MHACHSPRPLGSHQANDDVVSQMWAFAWKSPTMKPIRQIMVDQECGGLEFHECVSTHPISCMDWGLAQRTHVRVSVELTFWGLRTAYVRTHVRTTSTYLVWCSVEPYWLDRICCLHTYVRTALLKYKRFFSLRNHPARSTFFEPLSCWPWRDWPWRGSWAWWHGRVPLVFSFTNPHSHIRTLYISYPRAYVRTYVHSYKHTYVHEHVRTYTHTYINRHVRTYIHSVEVWQQVLLRPGTLEAYIDRCPDANMSTILPDAPNTSMYGHQNDQLHIRTYTDNVYNIP